jgi:hypothetical protein
MPPESRSRRITRSIAKLMSKDHGSICRLAVQTGRERSTISHWFTTGEEGRSYSMPVDVLPEVCDVLGTVDPLRMIADELGYDVVPRSRPTSCPRPVQDGVWDMLSRTADVGREVSEAARDGKIDNDEAMRIRAAAQNARDILDEMLARLPRPL